MLLDYTYWIDVCPTDGNLVAAVGGDCEVKIYDRRASKIVNTFTSVHKSKDGFISFEFSSAAAVFFRCFCLCLHSSLFHYVMIVVPRLDQLCKMESDGRYAGDSW